MKLHFGFLASSFWLLVFSTPAHAVTECQSTIRTIWAGDGGHIWITLNTDGAAVISPNDPNREAILALATSALLAGRQVRVRYMADNVNCNAVRTDVVGMYLL